MAIHRLEDAKVHVKTQLFIQPIRKKINALLNVHWELLDSIIQEIRYVIQFAHKDLLIHHREYVLLNALFMLILMDFII
jgi:hypothetical protein